MSSIDTAETHEIRDPRSQPIDIARLRDLENRFIIPVSQWTSERGFTVPLIRERLERMRDPRCTPYGPYRKLEFMNCAGSPRESEIEAAIWALARMIDRGIIFRSGAADRKLRDYLDITTKGRPHSRKVFGEMCRSIDVLETCRLLDARYKEVGHLELPKQVMRYQPEEQVEWLNRWNSSVIADVVITKANTALAVRWTAKIKEVEVHLKKRRVQERKDAARAKVRAVVQRVKKVMQCSSRHSSENGSSEKSNSVFRALSNYIPFSKSLCGSDIQTVGGTIIGSDASVCSSDERSSSSTVTATASTAVSTVDIKGKLLISMA